MVSFYLHFIFHYYFFMLLQSAIEHMCRPGAIEMTYYCTMFVTPTPLAKFTFKDLAFIKGRINFDCLFCTIT